MDVVRLSEQLLTARARGRRLVPLTASVPDFTVEAAYHVAAEVLRTRLRAGERPVGRKIGFTNRTIWDEYGVHGPIWSHMYDSTVRFARDDQGRQSLNGAMEPRIEPEIAFKFKNTPPAGATPEQLVEAIEWVAHAYEIVVSPFPKWKFKAADTIAAFGLHGTLIVGTPMPMRELVNPVVLLASFNVKLLCDGVERASGGGANVLGSPMQAISYLQSTLRSQPQFAPLRAGEIVTTGTLTAALPIKAGQRWSTQFTGLPLPGLRIAFE